MDNNEFKRHLENEVMSRPLDVDYKAVKAIVEAAAVIEGGSFIVNKSDT